MIAGFGITMYYLIGTLYGAPSFVETWGWLSGASAEAMARCIRNSRLQLQLRLPMLKLRRPRRSIPTRSRSLAGGGSKTSPLLPSVCQSGSSS